MKNIIILISTLIICVSCGKEKTETPPVPKSKWITEVLDYKPAPGSFINTSIGTPASAQSIIGSSRGAVTLGGFGGYIVFKFDHKVLNLKNQVDFVIHGNSFDGSSEPAAVMVAADANKNGVADDVWYELQGAKWNDPQTVHDYSISYTCPADTSKAVDVAWLDNAGVSGSISAIRFHRQSYFPLFMPLTSLTLSGTLVRSGYVTNDKGVISTETFAGGYADNFSQDYSLVVNDDPDTKNSNKFDIQTAVDNTGNSVSLQSIDFVKVYNCLNMQNPLLGESSPEICGAISLTF